MLIRAVSPAPGTAAVFQLVGSLQSPDEPSGKTHTLSVASSDSLILMTSNARAFSSAKLSRSAARTVIWQDVAFSKSKAHPVPYCQSNCDRIELAALVTKEERVSVARIGVDGRKIPHDIAKPAVVAVSGTDDQLKTLLGPGKRTTVTATEIPIGTHTFRFPFDSAIAEAFSFCQFVVNSSNARSAANVSSIVPSRR